ncbi:MAG: DNA recombination protein RmuC [Solirubrobacterales bacterium]|nr:DNA recombination protein RmuC [Solirubrobacterales bacterium]
MFGAALAILAIVLIGVGWLLLRTRESNARLAEASRRSEERAAEAKRERDDLREFGESLKQVERAVTQYKSREDDRDSKAREMLAGVVEKSNRVVERVDGLVGRWANPKQRGQLSEEWLVAALRQMGLRDNVHFEVQKRVEIDAARGQKDGVIDVYLLLPNSQGVALDAKFPWVRLLGEVLDEGGEEAREFALRKLRDSLRSHIKDVGGREYRGARDVSVRHVLVVVPDWQTLELVRGADPKIVEYASEHGVGLLPADGLYEMANALAEVHREEGWGERIGELFTPQHADRMFAACIDLLGRMGTVAKRYNSLGESLESVVAAFGPNGLVGRDVLDPAARAAEKVPREFEAEIRELDSAKAEKHAARLEEKRSEAEAA